MTVNDFKLFKSSLISNSQLRSEFELAFAAIASKHHPSDRAERFVFGGACEWLLAIAAWKSGIKAIPAGHGQDGFDLVQFKSAMQGLWSVKSSASTNISGSIHLRNNVSTSDKATEALYQHATIFMGPYLPGITYVDFANNDEMAKRITYEKDAAKIKTRAVFDYALSNPENVIPVELSAVANSSQLDSNLKIVANVLTSGTYPILGTTVDILQNYADKITVLRELNHKGNLSDEEFQRTLKDISL
jgi:hypothetical protein